MSYDGRLAQRVRKVLAAQGNVVERRMIGALCFMVQKAESQVRVLSGTPIFSIS